MAEPKKQDQALRIEPCMNGWTVTHIPHGGNNIMNLPYVFTERRHLGDFVAEWYREPECVATNRGPCEPGEIVPDSKYKSKYDPGRFFSETE